jgi:hypothetical protein
MEAREGSKIVEDKGPSASPTFMQDGGRRGERPCVRDVCVAAPRIHRPITL